MISPVSNAAEATTILQAMKDYRRIPVHFLARVVGRRPSEIQETLRFLADEKIVSVDDDMVSLIGPTITEAKARLGGDDSL